MSLGLKHERMDRNRNDEGQFAPAVENEDILDHLRDHDRPSERTAKSVANAVDLDRSTAYRRLEQLVEQGHVEKDDLGKNVVYLPRD